jgi:hypothetical protein
MEVTEITEVSICGNTKWNIWGKMQIFFILAFDQLRDGAWTEQRTLPVHPPRRPTTDVVSRLLPSLHVFRTGSASEQIMLIGLGLYDRLPIEICVVIVIPKL